MKTADPDLAAPFLHTAEKLSTGIRGGLWGRTLLTLLTFLLIGSAAAPPLSGQVLQGYLVDDSTRLGVEGVTVRALEDGREISAAISDREGWFSLTLPGFGSYSLEAQRLGYALTKSESILLDRADTVTVELRLSTVPVLLEPLVVTAGRGRGSSRFYERMESWGKGIFMTPAMLDSINPNHPADVLRGQEETWLSWRQGRWSLLPRIKTYLGSGCVEYALDGRRIDPELWGNPVWERSPLAWISGTDLKAVEFYRYVGEAPPELRRFARDCGLLVFWTEVGWED